MIKSAKINFIKKIISNGSLTSKIKSINEKK